MVSAEYLKWAREKLGRQNMSDEKNVAKSRGLFQVHAINHETDEVVFEQKVVAESETEALYESDLKEGLKQKKLSKEDVDILVTEIGPLPAKEKPKTVKLLNKLGEMFGKN